MCRSTGEVAVHWIILPCRQLIKLSFRIWLFFMHTAETSNGKTDCCNLFNVFFFLFCFLLFCCSERFGSSFWMAQPATIDNGICVILRINFSGYSSGLKIFNFSSALSQLKWNAIVRWMAGTIWMWMKQIIYTTIKWVTQTDTLLSDTQQSACKCKWNV